MKVAIPLSRSILSRQAMLEHGLSPKALAMKPGTRVHRDRRREHRAGYSKHRARLFD